MQAKNLSLGWLAAAIIAVTVLGAATRSAAQQERTLYSFDGTDGSTPSGGVTFDAAGNLYGTTQSGGAYGGGTVFELTPKAGGIWTGKTLHNFGNGTDGAFLQSSLILDAAGNLYGTTDAGGAYGDGTVFELSPKAGGGWAEKVLHNFNGTDGEHSDASLIFDAAGNLYSTTYEGGAYGGGTVFELTPKAGGGWVEKVLHNFGSGPDGAQPQTGLIFDAAGNLYSTTYNGGANGEGTVFELMPKAGGGSTEKVLYSFEGGTDGINPIGELIFDAAGNLYGTTYWGGTHAYGTVFELTPNAGGGWTEKSLHGFPNNFGTEGSNPVAGVILDAAGNLYGTTNYGGGASPGNGTVFELRPTAGGSWEFGLLHSFDGTDGSSSSYVSLIVDAAGNLYDTTGGGGAYGGGTVFEITH
jgi:uncharacterized repeat protein (TIGR03803 family)